MIAKYCDRCRRRLRVGQECRCTRTIRNETYISDDFYHSSLWEQARELCIADCCGLDLYALFVQHKIEFGRTVHHIMPLEEYPKLRLERDNLIYLSDANHRLVHSHYSDGKFRETAALLRDIKKRFCRGELPD